MPPAVGLFITGTDTGVGKTYVTSLIARRLRAQGRRVGVYKPAASGCRLEQGRTVADDALELWLAAGKPLRLIDVCPQSFLAPLAPHLSAREEDKTIDTDLLFRGLETWNDHCDVVLVEGIGGLMSPVSDELYVADLAHEFGYPIVVVAPDVLGTINQTLQTLIAARAFRDGLNVAGIVLNEVESPERGDFSRKYNHHEIERRCDVPLLMRVAWQASEPSDDVDWWRLAQR